MKIYKSFVAELKLKYKVNKNYNKVKIIDSKNAYKYIINFFDKDDINIIEKAFILLLNRAGNTIGYINLSTGNTSATLMESKLITKYAIDSLASGVILCHNHPSGEVEPSIADKTTTKNIKEALKYFDISLLDHLIITKDTYLSFADEGLI